MTNFLRPKDVAAKLSVRPRVIYLEIRRGHLKAFKVGRQLRVSSVDLDQFISAHGVSVSLKVIEANKKTESKAIGEG